MLEYVGNAAIETITSRPTLENFTRLSDIQPRTSIFQSLAGLETCIQLINTI